MYIIKDTNERYYMNWVGNTPVFNGDISSAKFLSEEESNEVMDSLRSVNKKKIYEKVLCDETLTKLIERNNPDWYRQQIETLLNNYKKKSEETYEVEPYSIYVQIVGDLEGML